LKYIPLVFALTLFSFPLCAEWRLSYLITPSKEYNSLRLLYKNDSPFEWTYSEINVTSSGIRFILNLTLRPVESENPNIQFKASVPQESKTIDGYLFGGGEKILVSDKDTAWLIHQLIQGQSVNIEFEFYKTTLQPDKFRHLWSRAKHLLANEKIALK
jgi:hypothetical protein